MGKKDKAAKAEKHSKDREKTPAAEVEKVPESSFVETPVKVSKSRLDERQITLISKALADPTRMAVLRAIAKGGATCGDLKNCTQVSAATLSHHMKELEAAGLIETERKGRFLSASLHRRVWKSYLGELKSFAE